MPQKTVTQTQINEELRPVAVGSDGKEISVGDFVDVRLFVTHIRIKLNPRTGLESGQVLELAHHGDDGYNEQYMACPATMAKKANDEKSEGRP